MTDDMEREIRRGLAVAPGPRLDRDVERVIASAERLSVQPSRRGIPLWAAVVACSICLMLGAWIASLVTPAPSAQTAIVYVVEPTPEFIRWLESRRARSATADTWKTYRQLETVFAAGGATSPPAGETVDDL